MHPTIALAPADRLVRAQSAYAALDSVATVLPWITLLVLAVGVFLARVRLRTLFAVGLGVALAPGPARRRGSLAGSPPTATAVRHQAKSLLGRIRGGPTATSPVGTWVAAHVRGLRIGAVGLAALLFVFLPQPTGVAILLIAVGLLVVLAGIEFLARPGPPRSPHRRRRTHSPKAITRPLTSLRRWWSTR